MSLPESMRVGYVVKRYPRYSETFIVNEILAHEQAGLDIEIFALRPPNDTHFQDVIARVRAPVRYLYLPSEGLVSEQLAGSLLKATAFWALLEECSQVLPGLWAWLEIAQGEDVRDVFQAVLLAREVRRRGLSHLHAHFAFQEATVARLAARLAGVPYTFTAHAKDIFHESVRPADLQRKLSDAAAVITVSDYNVQYLRQRFGAAAVRVQRIYNGMDVERFPYQAPSDRQPRIVGVGRLIEKKGFGDLIDACAILAQRGRDFSCQIIGTGAQESQLKARVEQLGLRGRVELLGPRPQSEVIRYIQGAAVFAAPCVVCGDGDRDGLPTVLLESMALGTPCVSTDVTGISEVVHDGDTGLMAPQHDAAGLAAAIERLLADSALRVRLAENARRLIKAEFDIQRNTGYQRDVFRKAVQSAPTPSTPARELREVG